MNKFLIAIALVLATALAPIEALALGITAAAKYDLNNRFGGLAYKYQLGTMLETATTGSAQSLADGKVWLGDATGAAVQVTPSGDVTWSDAGVTAIGAGKVTEAMLLPLAANTGLGAMRVAHAVWDPSGVSGQRTVAAHGLGVSLPARAIITQSFFHAKTSVVSTNNDGTVAFSCTAANDILSAADIDASSGVAGAVTTGVSTGSAANMKLNGSSACEITATVAVDAFTAGKIDIFVEYVVSE